MLSKENYERLKQIALEINQIMLESNLHELTVESSDNKYHCKHFPNNRKNEVKITSRDYNEIGKQKFCYGSFYLINEKCPEYTEYNWDYESFAKIYFTD